MAEQITKRQAEACLAAVRKQFKVYIEALDDAGPKLHEPGAFDCAGWTIAWEDGPYEWAYRAFSGGFDEEMYGMAYDVPEDMRRKLARDDGAKCPDGVFAEPVYSYVLGLYRSE